MFEKEAIIHAFEATIGIECLNKHIEDFTYEELSDEQQEKAYDFKKGAEFGYNKVNEWHYPSKGEYPKECENVLCYCKVVDVKFCSIGYTIIGGDDKIRWWSSNRSEELEVYAWKEIELPKEIKENDKVQS